MDDRRFDALVKSLATPKTRRGLLGTIAALGAGLVGARAAGAQVSQAHCGNGNCKNNPGKCNPGCVCCDYGNGNTRCRPPGACSPGQAVCPPGQVVDPIAGCVAPTTTTTTTTTVAPCAPGTTRCGSACVDMLSDPANCGACGNTCDDGSVCTTDTCSGGVCVNTPISCDDGDVCTDDRCDPVFGCGHFPIVCEDGNPCTNKRCDKITGCYFVPNDSMCSTFDGTLGTCSGGECRPNPTTTTTKAPTTTTTTTTTTRAPLICPAGSNACGSVCCGQGAECVEFSPGDLSCCPSAGGYCRLDCDPGQVVTCTSGSPLEMNCDCNS